MKNFNAKTITLDSVNEAIKVHGQTMEEMQANVSSMLWSVSLLNPDNELVSKELRRDVLKAVFKFVNKQHGLYAVLIDNFAKVAFTGFISIKTSIVDVPKSQSGNKEKGWLNISERFTATEHQCNSLWKRPKDKPKSSDDSGEAEPKYKLEDINKSVINRLESMISDTTVSPLEALTALKVTLTDSLKELEAQLKEQEKAEAEAQKELDKKKAALTKKTVTNK